MMRKAAILLISLLLSGFAGVNAQIENDFDRLFEKITSGTDVNGQFFILYQASNYDDKIHNKFALRRGYITFNKKFNNTLSLRFTQDIILDEEGSDAGNIEMRLKYLQLRINNNYLPIMRNTWWDIGMIARPMLSFEESVNSYRVQSAMYAEKYRVVNSADFGVSFSGLIGGEVSGEYQQRVSSSFPGLYGSYSIGIYNGGGYHAMEYNNNKTIEGRFSIRPLGNKLPGLQISYNFIEGKGNTENTPLFRFNHLMLSWQSERTVASAQVITGRGNYSGTFLDEDNMAARQKGYSLFGELRLLPTSLSLMSRYDYHLTSGVSTIESSSAVFGICHRFLQNSKLLLSVDFIERGDDAMQIYEAAVELRF